LLESYSFERVLERGFVPVTDKDGHLVPSAVEAQPGDAVSLRFHDGTRGAVIEGQEKPVKVRPSKRGHGGSSDNQGSLL
jgi:exodeoxyribonuclease VII large subunit